MRDEGGGRKAIVCVLLAVLVFAIFGKTVHYRFVYDDTLYITGNPMVQKGLTFAGFLWAFTFGDIGHWHPLTWMSHMLDCQIFGVRPGGPHITNVILHAAAAALLFLVLFQMTGAMWRCAFVAAAWAIHPLRAESVAWIAERKDVLSGVFFMLALGAYVRWVRQPSLSRRVQVAVLFALGLMSKDMLVTFPCVLLLLDYWPLGRLERRSQLVPLLKEKIPLFVLSIISCVITFLVPETISAGHQLSFWVRIQNALISYCIYLRQTVWPAALSANYPNPTHAFGFWETCGSLALLCLISAAVFLLRKSRPYLIAGWLWFVGMLAPVIGVVQISHYAHADRYTYLPQIGLWIAGTWMVCDLAADWQNRRLRTGAFAAVILCALSVATWAQTSYWRDSITLWSHAVDCDPSDAVAHNNLGVELNEQGNPDAAIPHYVEALRVDPNYAQAHYNLGLALEEKGRVDEAMGEYGEALRVNPDYAEAHNNLGFALYRQGRVGEAINHFREAVRIDPAFAGAYNNLGNALLQQRQTDEAIANFGKALQINPGYAEAHSDLANALAHEGRMDEATAHYREALRINPNYANARYNLGNVLFRQGQAGEAIQQLEQALALQPGNAVFQNALALVLATAQQASLRNGARALELATAANKAAGGNDPMVLRTLAAAYAEAGEFPNAAETARKALQLVGEQSKTAWAVELQREIQLYDAGRKYESGR